MLDVLGKAEERLKIHQNLVIQGVGYEKFVKQSESEIQIVQMILHYQRDETTGAPDVYPGRRLRTPYTIVYDRAQPNTLRITVVFLRNTWLSITIVNLRVVYGRP